MDIQTIHSFLVHPDKGAEDPTAIRGTRVTGEGQLVNMLRGIFEAAPNECKYEIAFLPNEQGRAICGVFKWLERCEILN